VKSSRFMKNPLPLKRSNHFLYLIFLTLLAILMAGCGGALANNATPTPFASVIAQEDSATATATPLRADESPTLTATPISDTGDENVMEDTGSPTVKPPATVTPIKTVERPTATPIPSATPTSAPQVAPSLGLTEPQPIREGISTPATAIPTAVPEFDLPGGTTNVILLGNDAPVGDQGVKRTDTMIVVSVNRENKTAAMISLPRDLYVYIPGGTMNRLNAAITLGGVNLLKQTILYNFGIPIHYYAQVDFAGFEEIVDGVGGVDLAVSCGFKDWRIKAADLDPEDEENWYVHELEPGIHHMDGETALWYARSRLMSSDFDRGRRQQQLLRAMLNQGVDLDLVAQVPALWGTFNDTVETDMDIGRILQIASLAPAIRENGVQNLYLFGKTEGWIVPETNAQVQLPVWEGPGKMGETIQRLFLPPALNKATSAPIFVEIVNASGDPDLALLAADNLAWYGFVPVHSDEEVAEQETTTLTYYAPNFKGSYDWLISWVFNLRQSEIFLEGDEQFDYDYQVILGEDYDPCLNQFFAPQAFIP
jgi:polyisoprenyl-teichoic acid--peptidoglycan teichoic acid transferase